MTSFWKQDIFIAILITFFVSGCGIWLIQNQSNNYYEVTAQNIWVHKTAFLKNYDGYFNELIPTKNGQIIALPPLPLLPTLIGSRLNLGEIQMTRLGIGVIIGLMYLILRNQGLSKLKAFLSALLYLIVTPLLFFFVEPGYWQTAQVWGVVGAEIALLLLLKDHYFWVGIGTVIAMLSRLNLGVVIAIGFSLYILKYKKMKDLFLYLTPTICGFFVLLYWNYYRFGSIFISGYELIPGVLNEPWYAKGIMHWSYIYPNLKRFLWQMNLEGNGLGIIWAEPYLLLLPLVINKKNLWLACLGITQFILVLAHGFWGAYQFDFRFLMDCLWIFVPILILANNGWKQRLIWMAFLISAGVHLTFIGRFL